MFASHPDQSGSSNSLRRVVDRILHSDSGRAESFPNRRQLVRAGDSRDAVRPLPQKLSALGRRRAFAGRSQITVDELRSQEWLDDRLVAFYDKRHGLWPRLRRFFAGSHQDR
jgi:hypothetical protein